jgi:hypothetical protein
MISSVKSNGTPAMLRTIFSFIFLSMYRNDLNKISKPLLNRVPPKAVKTILSFEIPYFHFISSLDSIVE